MTFGAIALIHILDLQGKLDETPYLGVAYVGLVLAAIATAFLLLQRRTDRTVWFAAGGLAAATLVGYAINRTVGMPGATEDIGNWLEPLGLASIAVEAYVVGLAAYALRVLGDPR